MARDELEREELAPFARDAVMRLDEQAAAVRPDFAAMMARAREIAAEPQPLARVIPLVAGDADAESGASEGEDAGLGAFTSALRGQLDAKVNERSLAGIPPLVVDRGASRWWAVGGVLAAAAALLLVVFGSRVGTRVEPDGRGVEANAAGTVEVSGGAARSVVVPGEAERVGEVAPEAAPEAPKDVAAPVEVDVPEDRSPVLGDSSKAKAGRKKSAVGPSLEEEAQALWQRGELAAAEAKLRALVRGGGRRAELAYGDLFALSRQMYGADGQAKVWREYLQAFPRGRFAEDARAGLCQRAGGGEKAACWRGYLEFHPDGAHREQAAAAQGSGP